MKIAVAGAGYVGLSLATLLSLNNEVVAYDIDQNRVEMINSRVCPIKDNYLNQYFEGMDLNLWATCNYEKAFKDADYIIISTPTNYDEQNNNFDTTSVEEVIKKIIGMNTNANIVIKSTVPVGFTEQMKKKYNTDKIMFSPEFLREGNALYDNLYPSRIIVGDKNEKAAEFATLLMESALKDDIPVLLMNSTEAEAVKLFANTYLALRISYFNELDTFAELKDLNAKDIVDGVCLDPRIGNFYNNPSFGYGGYCLPKDTKQLLANCHDVPSALIGAIVDSNDARKKHIARMILKEKPKVVGVYRLIMKTESDNFRASAIQGIINIIKDKDIDIVIYEPTIKENTFNGFEIVHDLKLFKNISDIIIVNRNDTVLDDVKQKVYTRDIFGRD